MAKLFIPTFNSEKTILPCLKSALNVFMKKDITVVDSGSTDNTIKYVNSYGIKILKSTSLANGRNVAIKNCKSNHIAFIDSDVEIDKNWLNCLKLCLKNNLSGACGNLVEKNQNNLPDKWRAFHLKQNFGKKQVSPDFVFGSNAVFKLADLKKVSGYNEKYKTNYEDFDISLRLKKKGFKLGYSPDAVCYHLKKDTYLSVMRMARKWSFFSYPIPDSFTNLILRLIIYNFHYSFNFFKEDLKALNFCNIIITLSLPFYFGYYDTAYYLSNSRS